MAEYIEREALLDRVYAIRDKLQLDLNNPFEDGVRVGFENVEIEIENYPAADVREVVLCKNCYAYRKDKELAEAAYLNGEQYCALLRCEMPEDGFCWYGCPDCGADMREES